MYAIRIPLTCCYRPKYVEQRRPWGSFVSLYPHYISACWCINSAALCRCAVVARRYVGTYNIFIIASNTVVRPGVTVPLLLCIPGAAAVHERTPRGSSALGFLHCTTAANVYRNPVRVVHLSSITDITSMRSRWRARLHTWHYVYTVPTDLCTKVLYLVRTACRYHQIDIGK